MSQPAPVILFAYNRPEHTRRTLEALAKNTLAGQTELTIYADGPRAGASAEVLGKIEATRQVCRQAQGFRSVRLVEREKNFGLAPSIIAGVTEAVERSGRVIVLEDDLLTSPHFLQFCNDALERYEHRPDILHIQGYVYPVKERLPETFLTAEPGSWGWATWKDRWQSFEPDAEKLLARLSDTHRFDFDGAFPYTEMLRQQARGEVSSWAIRWYATGFLSNRLSVWPGRSLIRNIGMDGTGTHKDHSDLFDTALSPEPITQFTQESGENPAARRAIVRFHKESRSFRYRLWGKLRRMLSLS